MAAPRGGRGTWGALAAAVVAALAVRLLLCALPLYRSTDFEVHRNWLAITHSLPLSRWYFEETSQWTLDYPPLFAYFEWALSQAAAVVDPEMLRVNNLEYASPATVTFQRCSVIACDLLLLAGAYAAGGGAAAPVALVLLNPALLLVDHIHFQYNGMLLGLLLLSAADLDGGRTYRGAFLFCLLLSFKQIFLYVAPVYFVYLLRGHCGLRFTGHGALLGFQLRYGALVQLGLLVVLTFAAVWLPVVCTGQAAQAASRMFPFGRGLTHAYWAPNVWAIYNTLDRGLAKIGLGAQGGQSSTAGFAEVYESSVLWTVPPKATFALTLLAYAPLLVVIWRRTPPEATQARGCAQGNPPRQYVFTLYVALGCAVSFACGWHVHEKAILMVTIPLLAAAAGSRSAELCAAAAALSLLGTFSVLPLLPQRRLETAVKWALLVAGHASEACLLHRSSARGAAPAGGGRLALFGVWPLPGALVVLGVAALGAYVDAGGHQLLFGGRMEFLPLLLVSDFSAVLVLGCFGRLFLLAGAPGASGALPR
ncbi:unnamed protein product, partial [Prorocentrum cordatum]